MHFARSSMKHFNKMVLLSGLLLVCMAGFAFIPPMATAQEVPRPQLSPVNPSFLEHQERMKMGTFGPLLTEEGHALGYLPSPLDLSHLKGAMTRQEFRVTGVLPTYDLRLEGRVTAVKNQGNCGSCWTFATYGSLESILLPSESADFSENNLNNTHGFDWAPCDGGNGYISAAYLTRWDGPINEVDDPYYPVPPYSSPPGLSPQKHLQDIFIIPDRTNSTDNDNLKSTVVNYGAVYTTMYWSDSYYNLTYKAYYFSGSSSSNHAVAIVGWDDNFDKNKFSTPPAGNGAFIIKNSWGTSWGESGYFYISYYDSNVGTENFVFHDAQATTNYARVYQYDPLGWVTGLGYGTTTAWFANVFTATENEPLSAVGFYTPALNSSYEIYIYTNATSGPRTGSLSTSQTGSIWLPGYHTVSLNSFVNLSAGQKFSVVVKLTSPGYTYPVSVEYPYGGYASAATANTGESYISSDGTSWTDLTDDFANTNACLKAYTNSAPETVSYPSTLSGPTEGELGATYTFITGGSTSSYGHDVQYLVDWGDGDTGWLPVGETSAPKAWNSAGTYLVKSKSRCATDTGLESDWSEPHSVMISDVPYTTITVLTPNEGEPIPSGSTYPIQWGAPAGMATFNVKYSPNNGVTWVKLAIGTKDKQYNWPVPTPANNKTSCLIKVVGFDEFGNKVAVDTSNTPFKIEVVRLLSPNGGVDVNSGDPVNITWTKNVTKSPVNKVKLYFTKNDGVTWNLITTLAGSALSHEWSVPSVSTPKTGCRVKVVLLDGSGNIVGSDKSDSTFTIHPQQ